MTVASGPGAGEPGRRRAALVGALLAAATWAAAEGRPQPIPVQREAWLAGDGRGHMLVVDRHERVLKLFDNRGQQLHRCPLPASFAAQLEDGGTFAVQGQKVLIAPFAPAPGRETRTEVSIWNVATCREEQRSTVEGPVTAATAVRDGWLLNSFSAQRAFAGEGDAGVAFLLLRDDGRAEPAATLPRQLRQELARPDAPLSGAWLRFFVVGRQTYLVSPLAYRLLALDRKGEEREALAPPPCLEARGQLLTGQDAAQVITERFGGAREGSEGVQGARQRLAEQARAGHTRVFLRPVLAVSSFGTQVAVVVRPPDGEGRCRVDLWEAATGEIVGMVGVSHCPGFASLGRDLLWVRSGSENAVEPIPLPLALAPLPDPCAAAQRALAHPGRWATSDDPAAAPTAPPSPPSVPEAERGTARPADGRSASAPDP